MKFLLAEQGTLVDLENIAFIQIEETKTQDSFCFALIAYLKIPVGSIDKLEIAATYFAENYKYVLNQAELLMESIAEAIDQTDQEEHVITVDYSTIKSL